ncbi:Dps family protein [Porphyromonas pogonae]|uniref:Dps family protein n=1 Tax=Porphyromonas pogonae TaxID=867595 RepID=UPI002E77B684|nr:Dps family protein [Porphyromonas pogonae]
MKKSVLSTTGLKESEVKKVKDQLAVLLADFQIFYSNLRGLHWHIRGEQFFVLHKQYEEMYDGVSEKVDEVAERILQLGGVPENRYSQSLKVSEVAEYSGITTPSEGLQHVFETYKLIIAKEREIAELAGEASDEVTVDLMIGYLGEQEKLVWMLDAYMNK